MERKALVYGLVFCVLIAVAATGTDANNTVSEDGNSQADKVQKEAEKSGGQNTAENETGEKIENQVLKYAIESYKESLQTFKWATGLIVTLIGIIIAVAGYVLFRHSREHKEILADAKEARSKAEQCADKAQEKLESIDEKVGLKLKEIDELVEAKFKEIEEKGKAQIGALMKKARRQREKAREEAERQRKISELWNKGLRTLKDKDFESAAECFKKLAEDLGYEDSGAYFNWGIAISGLATLKQGEEAERLFSEAFEKYNKVIELKPDDSEAYFNWGFTLADLSKIKQGEEREKLLDKAIGKYKKAVELKSDYYQAYSNWGTALADKARFKEGKEAERLFVEAIEKYKKAAELKPDDNVAYKNWSNALLCLAQYKKGNEAKELLDEAIDKCKKVESIKRGAGSYNMACAMCMKGNVDECRKWLKFGEEVGTLPTLKYAMEDKDLEKVRDEEWFKNIRWEEK